MTFQEILEGICRHRANPMAIVGDDSVLGSDVRRKIEEIEWALQAITEKLRDNETEKTP